MNQILQEEEAVCAPRAFESDAPPTKGRWSERIVLPDWVQRLKAETKEVRAIFGRSALLPVIVVLGLIALIYNSGQLRALAIALTAPLSLSDATNGGGFGASYLDLVLWLVSCGALVWSWFLYLVDPGKRVDPEPPLAEVAIMHWILPLLVLSPFFLAKVTLWYPIVLLFLLQAGPLHMILGSLGGWRTWVGTLLLAVAIECMLHQMQVVGFVFAAAGGVCIAVILGLFWYRPGKRGVWCVIGVGYCFSAALSTALVPIAASSLLSIRPQHPHDFEPHGILLALWWISPGIMVNLVSRVPANWRRERSAAAILVLGALSCIWIACKPGSVFGLTTLCTATAVLLAAGSLLRLDAVRFYRHIGAYGLVATICYACWSLSPHPVSGELPAAQRLGVSRPSNFDAFFRRWLALRGETPQHHGPLLLVAVAGGGVRAAAHATLSLAAADDTFGGKFGDRTLAISAVSGGALGAATWLGQRVEHLSVSDASASPSPTALQLSRFYQRDFVSPTLNRLLAHDLPFGMLPGQQISDRDRVLAETWASSWDDLRRAANAAPVSETIFRRSVASLGNDPRLPIVIFNATSAADGRPALYSSVHAKYPGAWLLDTSVKVMDAVTDSARFAVVSPVGDGCALHEAAPPLHSGNRFVHCGEGFDPIPVADGGYNDNSGLASLESILDELADYDASLANVYVIIIRSNPEIGLRLEEGQRFDKGRAIPELLAPLAVLEAARSARSDLLAERWERRLGTSRVMTWDLDFARYASRKKAENDGPWHITWLDQRYNEVEALRRLQLAPLGWTLDRESFRTLYFESMTTPYIPNATKCESLLPQYTVLCRNLPAANSPRY
jgi:hypothetical protein